MGRPLPGEAAVLADMADLIVPFTVRAVCSLGVADLLAEGPRPVEDLARATSTEPEPLCRALRALASKGIFTEVTPHVFGLTGLSQPLRSDHPLSLRDAYPLLAAEIEAWAQFDHCVRTGEASFDKVHETDYWTWMATHAEDARLTNRVVASLNSLHLRSVWGAVPWHSFGTLVDVGGGTGGFLAGVLARFRTLQGILFDLPHVVATAPAVLAAAGVAERCAVVAGSFFDGLPPGADAYLVKTVLPGFHDTQAARILGRVREAMREDSVLLLLEAVIPPGNGYDVAKLLDVHALVLAGGRHRSPDELTALLASVDLTLTELIPTSSLTVVVARPEGRTVGTT